MSEIIQNMMLAAPNTLFVILAAVCCSACYRIDPICSGVAPLQAIP